MKIVFFLTVIIALYSCNNNLTTIGQDLIDNSSDVFVEKYNIAETYTIKLDSFQTSAGYSTQNAINELLIGQFEDRFSGKTLATPYFQIAPNGVPVVNEELVYDSVTFRFASTGRIWGDTVQPKLQTFYLHQLQEIPYLDPEKDNLFYNTDAGKIGQQLGVARFLPSRESMREAHFKLDDNFGRQLFDMMQRRNDVFDDSWSFMRYFKGLAIVSDQANTCMLGISAEADSLYMRFHFHSGEEDSFLDFPLTHKEYQFNNIKTISLPAYLSTLNNQQSEVPFSNAAMSIAQGLNGYMIKLNLPNPPITDKYTTIIKAEIELVPLIIIGTTIPDATTMSTYVIDNKNGINGYMYNNKSSDLRVTGKLVSNPLNVNDNKFIFDVTGYYQTLSENPPSMEDNNPIVLSVPNLGTSFDRLIIEEIPVVKLYYAKYN